MTPAGAVSTPIFAKKFSVAARHNGFRVRDTRAARRAAGGGGGGGGGFVTTDKGLLLVTQLWTVQNLRTRTRGAPRSSECDDDDNFSPSTLHPSKEGILKESINSF